MKQRRGPAPRLEQPELHPITFEKPKWVKLTKIAKARKTSAAELVRQATDRFLLEEHQAIQLS